MVSLQVPLLPPIPEDIQGLLGNCLDCHDTETKKGEILLEFDSIDWKSEDNLFLWERVKNALDRGEMPPAISHQGRTGKSW